MHKIGLHILLFFLLTGCLENSAQQLGGPCEGCEAALEYEGALQNNDTLEGYLTQEPRLRLEGRVLDLKGNPVEGVVLYIHQTNRDGIYPVPDGSEGWGRRHGKHRGWIRTGKDGRYTFYTFRPGAYPGRTDPEHIHLFIAEAGKRPYYADDFVFADDPRLTNAIRQSRRNRCGSGILALEDDGGELLGKRDIILGKNIPHYE